MSIQGPSWDIDIEYKGIDDSEFILDFEKLQNLTNRLFEDISNNHQETDAIVEILEVYDDASSTAGQMWNYLNCTLSVNPNQDKEQKKLSQIKRIFSQVWEAIKPLEKTLCSLDDSKIQEIKTKLPHYGHFIDRVLEVKDTRLSTPEEKMIASLFFDGHMTWETLYNKIQSTIRCKIEIDGEEKELGIAQIRVFATDPKEDIREKAYHSVINAWKPYEDVCAAGLNSLAGWRLEICKKRSHTISFSFF